MENGRLFRLVSKLAFVTDRPSSDVGAASGDTGNSYLLQLFRDFVFHQGERDAGRVIDWGHIVENLNKVGEMYWQSFELDELGDFMDTLEQCGSSAVRVTGELVKKSNKGRGRC
jgi:hypothetical protein